MHSIPHCHSFCFNTASNGSIDELNDYMAASLTEMEMSLISIKESRDLTDKQFHKLLKCLIQKTNQGKLMKGIFTMEVCCTVEQNARYFDLYSSFHHQVVIVGSCCYCNK